MMAAATAWCCPPTCPPPSPFP
ncbi:hypothetical protein HaLaN_32692, partial [Haematococcus lacustris]